jgi:putative membrane protein
MISMIILQAAPLAEKLARRPNPYFSRDLLFGIIPLAIVWNIIIIGIVALIFWWLTKSSSKRENKALELLKERYVKGEIAREEFLKMREDLGE